jgi:hypothetical protein
MDTMRLNEEEFGDHAVMVGGMSPFTTGHQSVVQQMHRGKHSSVNVFTTRSTSRPIPAENKVGYISKAVPAKTNVDSTVTPLHALAQMYKDGKRGHVTFYGGSDRAEIAQRLKAYNGKEGGHGYYNFQSIHFKQVGAERSENAEGLAGVSGSKARAAKSPEELKRYIPKELHKDAVNIFNDINKPKEKKSLREAYLADEIFNLLEDVRTKDGKEGYIVYKGSNYVTIQLENKQTIKSWIFEIEYSKNKKAKINKPVVKETNYTLRTLPSQKIPALLIPSKQLIEESGQVSYQDYKTRNFEICPGAQSLMRKVTADTKLNPKYVKQALMALDKMFAIEKSATNTKQTSEDAHDFTMYATIAHDTLNLLGVEDKDLKFIEDHYKTYARLTQHHDLTYADEPWAHTVSGGGDIDEQYAGKGRRSEPGEFKKVISTDYQVKFSPEKGKFYKTKQVIISKGHKKIDDEDDGTQENSLNSKEEIKQSPDKEVKESAEMSKVSFSDFRKFIGKVDANTEINTMLTHAHYKHARKRIQLGLD